MIPLQRNSDKQRLRSEGLEHSPLDARLPAGPLPGAATTAAPAPSRPRIRSEALFSGGREVLIEHAGETYSLRRTSKGKLILTK